ncbi:TrbC/VirB2 family protein, partial [Acinetobacter baumannii]
MKLLMSQLSVFNTISQKQRKWAAFALLSAVGISSTPALAVMTLPITGILCDFFHLMTGPVGYAISGIVVVILGLLWAA